VVFLTGDIKFNMAWGEIAGRDVSTPHFSTPLRCIEKVPVEITGDVFAG
jgi:hypothetical protein